ncbi:ATP-NAD kinase domain-containing protein [Phthorimaea operculella]|nr:ATP-NAD kinase domain-containing protein [Phthorimaea operculella]
MLNISAPHVDSKTNVVSKDSSGENLSKKLNFVMLNISAPHVDSKTNVVSKDLSSEDLSIKLNFVMLNISAPHVDSKTNVVSKDLSSEDLSIKLNFVMLNISAPHVDSKTNVVSKDLSSEDLSIKLNFVMLNISAPHVDSKTNVVSKDLSSHAALTLRSRLQCVVLRKTEDGKEKKKPTTILVLNEVVVDRGPSPYLSNIDLFLDGKHITSVQGDGLIVSTPTGSTAYAVAAGASMIHPSVPAIMVTPICPHSLSFRPIVVPAGVELKIALSPEARNAMWVSFDGRNRQALSHGDSLYVTTSVYPVPSICSQDQISDWFDSLAECLHWNVRKKQKAIDELSDLTHSSSDPMEDLDNSHADPERPQDT